MSELTDDQIHKLLGSESGAPMKLAPSLRLGDAFQGGVPELPVWCCGVREGDIGSDGEILEDGGAPLHFGHAVLSLK